MSNEHDETLIRRLIENWAIWRDTGDWDRFREIWSPDGQMSATWFEGSASEFIEASRRSHDAGTLAHHVLGGTAVRFGDGRSAAETRMTLHLRTNVEGEPCDIACIGLFFDLLEKDSKGWRIVKRQPIYEKDRLDAVRPNAAIELNPIILNSFPPGYRHLAYAQQQAGMMVNRSLPGPGGIKVSRVYEHAEAWIWRRTNDANFATHQIAAVA